MAIDLAKYQNEGKYPRTFILFYHPPNTYQAYGK